MYENQVNCWRDKQRESSYLVRCFLPLPTQFVRLHLDSWSINVA